MDCDFNPRSREGSDSFRPGLCLSRPHFNPRSREGSDIERREPKQKPEKFQSTLPRRERHWGQQSAPAPTQFQSTLPRRERPSLTLICPVLFIISIHAPAKGATKNDITNLGGYLISIHAPAKGATLRCLFCNTSHFDFNPRSREGSDLI